MQTLMHFARFFMLAAVILLPGSFFQTTGPATLHQHPGENALQSVSASHILSDHALQSSICSSVTEIPMAECEALVALYDATNGPTWVNHDGWLQNNQPCSWNGITCDAGHVTRISMYNNNLRGTLPASISNLTGLVFINLYFNTDLSGPIPNELGNIATLETIELGKTNISGTLPDSLKNLGNLQSFSIESTQISGQFPDWILNLSNLSLIRLAGTKLEGWIPSGLSRLTKLSLLDVAGTYLCEPTDQEYLNWQASYHGHYFRSNICMRLNPALIPVGSPAGYTIGNLSLAVDYPGNTFTYSIGSGFDGTEFSITGNTLYFNTPVSNTERKSVKVNVIASGSSGTLIERVFEISIFQKPPHFPTVVSPRGVVASTPEKFIWGYVEDAHNYRVLAIGPTGVVQDTWYSFADAFCDARTCSAPLEFTPIPGEIYSWYMQAQNHGGESDQNSGVLFRVKKPYTHFLYGPIFGYLQAKPHVAPVSENSPASNGALPGEAPAQAVVNQASESKNPAPGALGAQSNPSPLVNTEPSNLLENNADNPQPEQVAGQAALPDIARRSDTQISPLLPAYAPPKMLGISAPVAPFIPGPFTLSPISGDEALLCELPCAAEKGAGFSSSAICPSLVPVTPNARPADTGKPTWLRLIARIYEILFLTR